MIKHVWNGFIAVLCVGLAITTTWVIGTIMTFIGLVTLPLQLVVYTVWSSKTSQAKDLFDEMIEKLEEVDNEVI